MADCLGSAAVNGGRSLRRLRPTTSCDLDAWLTQMSSRAEQISCTARSLGRLSSIATGSRNCRPLCTRHDRGRSMF